MKKNRVIPAAVASTFLAASLSLTSCGSSQNPSSDPADVSKLPVSQMHGSFAVDVDDPSATQISHSLELFNRWKELNIRTL